MGLAGVMKRERKDPIFASLSHVLCLYFFCWNFPKVLKFCVLLRVCQGFLDGHGLQLSEICQREKKYTAEGSSGERVRTRGGGRPE